MIGAKMNRTEELMNMLSQAYASFKTLFMEVAPDSAALRVAGSPQERFLKLLCSLLQAMRRDLEALRDGAPAGWDLAVPAGAEPDSADLLNELGELCRTSGFRKRLDDAMLEALIAKGGGDVPWKDLAESDTEAAFYHTHAVRLAQLFARLIPEYCQCLLELAEDSSGPGRIRPPARKLHSADSLFLTLKPPALCMELRKRAGLRESFTGGRVYRYLNGEFKPITLKGIRAVNEFYGYHGARQMFLEHFRNFSTGHGNLPLLITSLPGLGKTQMTISHSLYFDNILLIIPEPEDIATGLETLIRKLAACPDKKFMVFFDDIDNHTTNWYYFRANVGGTFILPPNIAVTITSNQQFPANISSRGRGFIFPTFDELRCQEMVSDFLVSKGMKNPSPELISVIASDYVEEFGQKKFEELSPRTLVRYLNCYHDDTKKCRRMLELSRGDLITRPDSQVFYEENVKLLRSIYGDSALEELRRRQLSGQ